MSSTFYRGDNRSLDDIRGCGFQPYQEVCRGRSTTQALEYLKGIIQGNNFKSIYDITSYIVASPKGDSVSTSRILDGASYGKNKFIITCPEDPLYFEFDTNGEVGKALEAQPTMSGGKPYYILTNPDVSASQYLIVGTRTVTQEATFFTDIPIDWISQIYAPATP